MKRALVTGSNKGIGFEISKQLADQGFQVIMTARNTKRGTEAALKLKNLGLNVVFMVLDIENTVSISSFVSEFQKAYDCLDVLINNAAILEDSKYHISNIPGPLLDRTLKINLQGPLLLTQKLLPALLKSDDPRIINLSSSMGALHQMSGGYPAYRISKAALNAFTKILAAEEPRLTVNSVSPGWVKTDMGGQMAARTVVKGAETPVWLATVDQSPSGRFFHDKDEIGW